MINKSRVIFGSILACLLTTASASARPAFELLHLWGVGVEAHALAAISTPVREQGVDWQEQLVDESNFIGIRTEYAERLHIQQPPSGVFWIGGASIHDLISDGTFRLIDNKIRNTRFSEILLPEVHQIVSHEDGIAALPLGIHLQNHSVYNIKILASLGLEVPRNWEQFLAIAPVIKNAGYHPISISDQTWQLRFLIVSILTSYLDDQQFTALLDGFLNPSLTSALAESLSVVRRLQPFSNPDSHNLNWEKAVQHVVNNRAVLNVLGDFSSPLLNNQQHLKCSLPPGNSYILWSLDTIALTAVNDIDQQLGQDIVINTVIDRDHNQNYIYRKGGVPVYKDINLGKLNACSRQSTENWHNAPQLLNLQSHQWTNPLQIIASITQRFWQGEFATEFDAAQAISTALSQR